MLNIQRILVTSDLTDESAIALDWSRLIAEPFNAAVTFACVVYPPQTVVMTEAALAGFIPDPPNMDKLENDARERLHELVGEHLSGLKVKVQTYRDTTAQHGIQQLAADGNYDLVVMATHGRTGLAHFIQGSITDEILREAKFPVLCLHEGALPVEKKVQIKRILCPLDFDEDHLEAARAAGMLAKTFSAELVYLHVAPFPAESSGWGREDEAVLMDRLKAHVASVRPEGIPLKYSLRQGSPAREINECANKLEADLIVMATHGEHGILDFFFGSDSEWVVRHSQHAVLVCPSK